ILVVWPGEPSEFRVQALKDAHARSHSPERDVSVDRLAQEFEAAGGRVLVRVEFTPEVLSLLVPVLGAGCGIAAPKKRAEVGLDRVGLGMLIAGSLVAQLVVDRGLVPRRPATGTVPDRLHHIGGGGHRPKLVLDDLVVVPRWQVVELRTPERR